MVTSRRRIRALRTATVALALVGIGVWSVAGPASGADAGAVVDGSAPAAEVVVVEAGQTLWDIAAATVPAGGNLEEHLGRLLDANDVEPSRLEPGAVVVVPAG